jgi:U3 small nucleolar RNA-associated protein 13
MLRTEDEALLTGDASGILKVWRDVSEEDALAAQMLRDETIIKEQQLSNMIMRKDYTNAILLAMQLEQPHRLYTLFGQIIDRRSIQESIDLLTALLVSFDETQIGKLTCWIRDWNTSLKRAYLSQLLLHVILKKHKTPALKEVFGHIQPYTERHFEKIDDLLIGSHLIDFVVNKIK